MNATHKPLFEISFLGSTYYLEAEDEISALAAWRARLRALYALHAHQVPEWNPAIVPVNQVRLPDRPGPIV